MAMEKCLRSSSICWLYILFLLLTLFNTIMENILIASLNVNGARDSKKRAELFKLWRQKGIDVPTVCLIRDPQWWQKCWMEGIMGWPFFVSQSTSTSGGVAILLSRNLILISYSIEDIVAGRLIKVIAQFETCHCFYLCIFPNFPSGKIVFSG